MRVQVPPRAPESKPGSFNSFRVFLFAREIDRFFRPQRNSLFWEIVPPQSRHNKFTKNALM
jgi:hypothetical protein